MLVGQRTAGEDGGGGGGGGQGQQDGGSLIRVVANGELREQVLNQVQQRCQPPFHLLLARLLSPIIFNLHNCFIKFVSVTHGFLSLKGKLKSRL